ncbi:hypothetical protein VB715_15365 [Crocosphaera sp. UHCC 0190]|uniref:hypothetical protein n=1 Tax=Crocosphaera sp. UHCC 0190 TaxID=3110246 RepID=UPI002B21BB25|nr:hypothetical protein [Crocosphaera sp. UHCC 0190]MEA5511152.1 hypothetical protein [Crocosphaera sp. UHCC 0190]
MLLIILYAKHFEPSIDGLFIPPATPPYPTGGLLTHTFQILCSIPPVVCGFTFTLLRRIEPKNKSNFFLLGSAIFTGGFLLNEIYRIHIILLYFNVSKMSTIQVYGVILLAYVLMFWNNFKATPYGMIIFGVFLLFLAVLIDSISARLSFHSLLTEGIPKLFFGINYALYFWLVCYQQIVIIFQNNSQKVR